MARILAALAVGLAILLPMADAQCQSSLGGACGDASRPRESNCCTTGYCQPWNSGYYQCLTAPTKCPAQETDIDYYGNDLKTIYGLSPANCCETCSTTSGCAAYTFVNQNADGKTACYLKTSTAGRRVSKGAVSAAYKDYVAPACSTPVWGSCGNAQGTKCCPTGAYCQPWDSTNYQCLTAPPKCPNQETDIDYYGNDLNTVYGLSPADCCERCSTTSRCAAYTFINANADGKTACYLKSSSANRVAKKGAVSAVFVGTTSPTTSPTPTPTPITSPTPTPTPTPTSSTCSAKVGDGCGNAQAGASCCPSGSYCQPWNQYYYQCIALPAATKCPEVHPGVDFYGADLRTVFGLLPGACCDACYNDAACVAYTFVNENADGKTACYLKTGQGTSKANAKAVSGFKFCAI